MLGFRTVLGKLQAIHNTRSLPMEHLLRLLQTGELTAHALFPSKLIPKVTVPRHYWQSITISELEQVKKGSSTKRYKGRYVIEISEILDEYLGQVLAIESPEVVRQDIQAVYRWEEGEREVIVTDEEWVRLVKSKNWVEPEAVEEEDDDDGKLIFGTNQRTVYSLIALMAGSQYGFVVRKQSKRERRDCRDALLSDLEKAHMKISSRTLDSLFESIDKFDGEYTLVK